MAKCNAAMLLLLPDELLLQITYNIRSNASLINLALTHRSFRNLVHETLVRDARIPVRSIPRYIALLSQHPSWANAITDIELQDSSTAVNKFSFDSRDLKAAEGHIPRAWTGYAGNNIRRALEMGLGGLLLWTPILLAALPNVSALRVEPAKEFEMPDAYRFFLRHWDYAHEGFWTPLLGYAQDRIQKLTVRAPNDIFDPIGVSHLTNLKTLIVDGECLRPAKFTGFGTHQMAMLDRTQPTGSLPLGLTSLHIYGDERTMPWQWLRELQCCQVPSRFNEQTFTNLQVRLFFNVSCRTLARFLVYKFEPRSYQLVDALTLVHAWEQSAVDFQTLFRDAKGTCDGFARPELYTHGTFLRSFSPSKKRPVWIRGTCITLKRNVKARFGDSVFLHKSSICATKARPGLGYLKSKSSPTGTPCQSR